MKCTYKKTKWGNVLETIEFSEQEFKDFVLDCLESFLKNLENYLSDCFEEAVENFDTECFRVKDYVMTNGKDFLKVLEKLYGDLGQRLLEIAKKEIIQD